MDFITEEQESYARLIHKFMLEIDSNAPVEWSEFLQVTVKLGKAGINENGKYYFIYTFTPEAKVN